MDREVVVCKCCGATHVVEILTAAEVWALSVIPAASVAESERIFALWFGAGKRPKR